MIFTKLRQTLRQLPPFRRVVAGVSGGPDSVALALLLKDAGFEVIAAHLNHGLRGRESDTDAAFVQRFAKKNGMACAIGKTVIPKKGNVQNTARRVRYRFLQSVKKRFRADAIAVAHHKDDQAETILMHLFRGAGRRGLTGMSAQQADIIRPLLGVTKMEILDYLKKRSQPYRVDSSNLKPKYLRNRLRQSVIPQMRIENPDVVDDLVRTGRKNQRVYSLLQEKARGWIRVSVRENTFAREDFQRLDTELKGEIVLELFGHSDLYRKHVDRAIAFIENAASGKTMIVKGMPIAIEYGRVRLETPRCTPRRKRLAGREVRWGGWRIKNEGKEILFARPWKPGDRFQPRGMNGSKKVQDFFADAKIPQSQRRQIPIIVNGQDKILAIGNLRLAAGALHLKKTLKIKV